MKHRMSGPILAIGKEQDFNGFVVQRFRLDLGYEYEGRKVENITEFQVTNNSVDLSRYKPGQNVEVEFKIQGKLRDRKDGQGQWLAQNLVVTSMSSKDSTPTQTTLGDF